MAVPTTIAEFVELVRKSAVVDEKRLDAHLDKLRAANALPLEPAKLAGLLVRDGVLTLFQAEQYLKGKWRGFTIGKYKVLEQLGKGGMGSVYLCEHKLMRRRVAVKVLPTAKADDPAALERFYREARAVAALDHPNIVRAYDIDQADKLHFLVMEYVDGASLQEMIKRAGPMDVIRAAHYMRQAALGLQHAHEAANIVHRDIKPANILVDRSGIVKVLDMGLARFFNDDEDILTKKYDESVLGTADYLAPEQAVESHDADIRADIYSLGATFYFCLTGRTPFHEGTVAQKLIWHQTRQPKPIRSLRPEVEESLVAVIDRMMAKQPGDRYQTPQAVVEALAPWTQTDIATPPEVEMPQLSPAARGVTGTGSDATLPGPNATGGSGSGTRKGWQVTGTQPVSGAVTSRPATPANRSAPPPPAGPRSGPPAAPPRSTPAPAPAAPEPAPRPAAASLLQATPVVPKPPAPLPAEEDAPWEKMAADTDDLTARLDTARDALAGSRSRRVSRDAARARQRRFWLLGASGVAGVAVVALVVWLLLRSKSDGPVKKNDTKEGPTTLYVGEGEQYPTVGAALNRVRSGDTILVRADTVQERLVISPHRARTLKDIRIMGDPDKTILWKSPSQGRPGDPLVSLTDVEGFLIKNFVFDGENKVADLIHLQCGCKGVWLDGLELRNYTRSGVCFINCMATKKRPVRLSLLKANSEKPPLYFDIKKFYPDYPGNHHIQVSSDCKFKGTFTIPMISFKAGDNATVELPPELAKRKVIIPGKK